MHDAATARRAIWGGRRAGSDESETRSPQGRRRRRRGAAAWPSRARLPAGARAADQRDFATRAKFARDQATPTPGRQVRSRGGARWRSQARKTRSRIRRRVLRRMATPSRSPNWRLDYSSGAGPQLDGRLGGEWRPRHGRCGRVNDGDSALLRRRARADGLAVRGQRGRRASGRLLARPSSRRAWARARDMLMEFATRDAGTPRRRRWVRGLRQRSRRRAGG